MAGFLGLARRNRHERVGFDLYGAAVAAARDPHHYLENGVPDTLDGRFDLVGLHAFLLIQRLKQEPEPGPVIAQAVFDAMFSDMDINLRELGVSDMSIGRRVRAMWEAFHGRAAAYATAMANNDDAALEAALARNLWRGAEPPPGAAAAFRRLIAAQTAHLSQQPMASLAAGTVTFLAAKDACR